MSIDFTGVKALTIPEGSVKKITRKSDGAMIWEKPVSEYKITLLKNLTFNQADYDLVISPPTGASIFPAEKGEYVVPGGSMLYVNIFGSPEFTTQEINYGGVNYAPEFKLEITQNLYITENRYIGAGFLGINIFTEDEYNNAFG